jgi:hypothetical protein
MSTPGPIGQAIGRARKLQARCAVASLEVAQALREASDEEVPRAVVAVLASTLADPALKAEAGRPGCEHWFARHLIFDPVILSAATLRAAKVVEGSSAVGGALAMPRRANDFPEATPFGLCVFQQAILAHCGKDRLTFWGIDKTLAGLRVGQEGAAWRPEPSLADALLLLLVPFFRSHEETVLKSTDPKDAAAVKELFAISEFLASARSGNLPGALPNAGGRLLGCLLEAESLHGMLHAALRAQVRSARDPEAWPPLLQSFLVRPERRNGAAASVDVPLVICALAAAWIRLTSGTHSPDRKKAVLADFRVMVAGCRHVQAATLETTLNRAIA